MAKTIPQEPTYLICGKCNLKSELSNKETKKLINERKLFVKCPYCNQKNMLDIEKQRKKAWWRNFWFGMGVGVLVEGLINRK